MQPLSQDTEVLTLGSDTILTRRVGPKAALLDRARVNGLPVPSGVLIPEELIRECYARYGSSSRRRSSSVELNVRLVREEFLRDRLLTALPLIFQDKHWRSTINNLEERPRVAIRPAFSLADGESDVPPASFQSELNVDGSSAILILEAIKGVLASAQIYQQAMYEEHVQSEEDDAGNDANLVGHNLRRDVLIMPMVPARHAGLAFSQRDYEDDVIIYTKGIAEPLTSGKIEGERIDLPGLHTGEKANFNGDDKPELEFLNRLQTLLQSFRKIFGSEKDWEIEWADDGQKIWLLQIRPQTRQVERREIFSTLPGLELFQSPASVFMNSVLSSSNPAIIRELREIDKSLPLDRPIIKNIQGFPAINVSLLLDICRILGLPSRLVTDYLVPPGRLSQLPAFKSNWRRIFLKFKSHLKLFKKRFKINSEVNNTSQILQTSIHEGLSLKELLEKLKLSINNMLISQLWLQISMTVSLRWLDRLGLLQKFLSRFANRSVDFLNDLNGVREIQAEFVRIQKEDPQTVAADQTPAQDALKDFWTRHSGFTLNPYDIASPDRTADLRFLSQARVEIRPAALNAKMFFLFPLWWSLKSLLVKSDQLKFDFIESLRKFRRSLMERLPDNESLWQTSLTSLLDLNSESSYANQVLPAENNEIPEVLVEWKHINFDGAMQAMPAMPTANAAEFLGVWPVDQEDLPLLSYLWKDRARVASDQWLALSSFPTSDWYELPEVQGLLIQHIARLSPGHLHAMRLGFARIIQCVTSDLRSNSSSVMLGPHGPIKHQSRRPAPKKTAVSRKKKSTAKKKISKKKASAQTQS